LPVGREVLLKRIEFLRDKQRFYEGFAAIVFGLYGLSVSLRDPVPRIVVLFTAFLLGILASYRHRCVEKELSELWAETMKDPKPEKLSLPLIATICGVPLLIATLLQFLGIVP